jgi:hypothetical protein
MEVAGWSAQPLVIIVIGLLLLGLVFKVIKGVIRLVLTVGIIAIVAYFVLNTLR